MAAETPPIIVADDFTEHRNVSWRIEPGVQDPNNPMLEPKYPWDLGATFSHGTVHRDPIDGLWKAWHLSTPVGGDDRQLTYACSEDGVHWDRPELDIYPCDGYERTNILLGSRMGGQVSQVSVNIIPEAPPERRYEMFCLRDPQYYEFATPGYGCPDKLIAGFELPKGRDHHFYGLYRHYSADGLHWNVAEGPLATAWYVLPLLPEGGHPPITTTDGIYVYRWDDRYVMFNKVEIPALPGAYIPYDSGVGLCRTIARRESADGSRWEDPYESIMTPDYLDPADTQFMELMASPYGDRGNGYIAVATVYHALSGTVDLQFAASADGKKWWRPARRPCVGLAPLGDVGGGMLWPTRGFVYDGPHTHLYYAALRGVHHDTYDTTRNCGGFYGPMCRVTWRTGRFWAAVHFSGLTSACREPASLTTPPADCGGKTLHVNAVTEKGGSVRAELVDEHGNAIEGFARDDSRPFVGDDVCAPLVWNDHERAAAGRASLRLILHNARLYGWDWR